MNTLVVWLLISVGSTNRPTMLVERFPTQQTCEEVQQHFKSTWADLRCVKATIVKP